MTDLLRLSPARRRLLPALVLFSCITVPGTADSSPTDSGGCAGIELYTAKPYASDKGIRRRCGLLQEIGRRGDLSAHPLRQSMLEEIANRFSVELEFEGRVELPGRVVDYLLDNMPEAAGLVSAYLDRDYGATQVDSTPGPPGFFVTNSSTFAARFTYLYSRSLATGSEHMFFESGQAKVVFWRIWGNSFVRYQLHRRDAESSRYKIDVYVFTQSRLLKAVLGSTLFKYFADRMFTGILDDIVTAVRRFEEDPDPGEHLPPYFIEGLNKALGQDSAPLEAR